MKYTGLYQSSLLYGFFSLLTSGFSFLLIPILTRMLDPDDYGKVAMFGVMSTMLSIFIGFGSAGAITNRFYSTNRRYISRYISSCTLILLCSGLITMAISYFFCSFIEDITTFSYTWVLIGVILAINQFIINLRLYLWQADSEVISYGIVQIGQVLLNALFSIFLIVSFGISWKGRVYGIVIASSIFSLVSIWSLIKCKMIRFPIKFEMIKDALSFGLPLLPHATGALLISSIDQIFITKYLGVDATGIYTVALQISSIVTFITITFNRAYSPWLFKNLKSINEEKKVKIVRLTYIYFLVLIAISVILGVAGPLILPYIVDEKYLEASNVIIFLSLGFAVGGMYFMVTNYVFFMRSTGKLSIVTISSGLINVVLAYFMIKSFGLFGAGIGFLVSQIILLTGTWYIAQKVFPMPWLRAVYLY